VAKYGDINGILWSTHVQVIHDFYKKVVEGTQTFAGIGIRSGCPDFTNGSIRTARLDSESASPETPQVCHFSIGRPISNIPDYNKDSFFVRLHCARSSFLSDIS
jgi:hypothetical protein